MYYSLNEAALSIFMTAKTSLNCKLKVFLVGRQFLDLFHNVIRGVILLSNISRHHNFIPLHPPLELQ